MKIDDRVAQRVAKLLTSSNIQDFERGVRIISRNSTLFRAIAGATRGAISSGDANSQEERRRQRGNVTVNRGEPDKVTVRRAYLRTEITIYLT